MGTTWYSPLTTSQKSGASCPLFVHLTFIYIIHAPPPPIPRRQPVTSHDVTCHANPTQRPAEVTLIREYIQSANAMGYSLPTGSFDHKKHASLLDVATAELAEEARLEGGAMVSLMEDDAHAGRVGWVGT
jgi:hypothetical protein